MCSMVISTSVEQATLLEIADLALDNLESVPCFVRVRRSLLEPTWSVSMKAGDRPNFGGLVLGCIEAKFCKKICV